MKIAVSSSGGDLEALTSPTFGRCPMFLFVETETMQFEAVVNPAVNAPGGAGIQAAQLVTGKGVQAVVTGQVGPKAMSVLQAAGVPVYLVSGATVREAVERFGAGALPQTSGSNVPPGQGKGAGAGRQGEQAAPPASGRSREAEQIAALNAEVVGLRRQLSTILQRLEQLEEGK